jgi:hypothetical protein
LGVGVFWFLLPANIYTRIPIVIFYGIGMYILSLTMNIYSVAAIRTIALLRAARGVGFVLTLLTSFLVFDTLLSLRSDLFLLLPAVFIISWPLFLQGYWSMTLDSEFSKELVVHSAISSLVVTEVAAILFFWPVTVVVGSIFLTVTFYILLGLGQAKLDERLFSTTTREHLTVGAVVFIAMLLATHWG